MVMSDRVTMLREVERLSDIGEQLRQARMRSHMTQAQLADLVGVTPKTVSAIERGSHFPAYRTLAKLAEHLGCEVRVVGSSLGVPPQPRPEGDADTDSVIECLEKLSRYLRETRERERRQQ